MAAPHFFPPGASVEMRKRAARATVRGRAGDDAALRDRLAAFLASSDAGVSIGAVWPLPGEPDLRPLLERLHAAGHALALPVVLAADRPLLFRCWHPGDRLVPGAHGTAHPPAEAVPASPGIILVPFLAFDRNRRRLGRGGGFYDRTLPAHPHARAIGFGYASREMDEVPAEPHDRVLDAIVTDREVIA